jgi:cell division protein FtsZ
VTAANMAISSPLLEDASVKGARGVIINVTGGSDFSLLEVNEAALIIQEAAHEDANIIFGAVVDPRMDGRIKITVIATGFDRDPVPAQAGTTPVDLQHYATRRQDAAIERATGTRIAIARRPVIELPALPMAAAATDADAAEGDRSALDWPSFLRRQSEG